MKKTRKVTAFFLAFVLMITSLLSVGMQAFAEELRYFERGVLTDGTYTAYYVIDKDNKVLYITGDGYTNGSTPDYPSAAEGPFAGRTDITRIVIEEDVARIGDYALSNMTKVDTLEVQSNLLSSSSSMSSKAMIGCTGLRHIQGDSALLSTDVFLEVVKGAVNIASGNWLSLIANGISIVNTGVSGDDSLDDEIVHGMVNDYITNGNKIFLGDLDEAIAAYNERIANPCYDNNAFNHSETSAVTTEATCTQSGVRTYTCSVCNMQRTEEIAPLGHAYTESVLYAPSCFVEGITKYYCTRCGSASYEAIPAYGHHTCHYEYNEADNAYTEVCSVCDYTNTSFDNDTSALIGAVALSQQVDSADYTPASYEAMTHSTEKFTSLASEDYLQYPQEIIDEKTAEILTKIDELVPYLKVKLSSDSLTPAISYDDVSGHQGVYSAAFGTEITLSAQTQEGYTFRGWYETVTKRYLSAEETYTFPLTSNMDIRAVYSRSDHATLTFLCSDGQIKAYFKKTVEEWNATDSLLNLVPEVPYSYGKTNGRWVYNTQEVLSQLRSGTDVSVSVKYSPGAVSLPAKPTAQGNIPALELYYDYDADKNIGNFIMAGDIPDGCQFAEIGIAFYYRSADSFEPTAFRLTMNNKLLTSKFDAVDDNGIYIVNFKKMSAEKNYAARGYVSYYDGEGNLKIAYTEQINIKNLTAVE